MPKIQHLRSLGPVAAARSSPSRTTTIGGGSRHAACAEDSRDDAPCVRSEVRAHQFGTRVSHLRGARPCTLATWRPRWKTALGASTAWRRENSPPTASSSTTGGAYWRFRRPRSRCAGRARTSGCGRAQRLTRTHSSDERGGAMPLIAASEWRVSTKRSTKALDMKLLHKRQYLNNSNTSRCCLVISTAFE